jgi:hypothetical protein
MTVSRVSGGAVNDEQLARDLETIQEPSSTCGMHNRDDRFRLLAVEGKWRECPEILGQLVTGTAFSTRK